MIEAFKKREKKENLAEGTYYLLDKASGEVITFFFLTTDIVGKTGKLSQALLNCSFCSDCTLESSNTKGPGRGTLFGGGASWRFLLPMSFHMLLLNQLVPLLSNSFSRNKVAVWVWK